jgi:hypothetical protein
MDTQTINYSMSGLAARAYRARTIALEMAGGRASLLRPQANGSVLIVNSPHFDTEAWRKPAKPKRSKK